MSLVNSKEVYKHALDNHYAIGAFNFVNMETLSSILKSCEDNHSPVIIQCSTGAIKYAGIKVLKGMVYEATKDLTIPVVWNLDHGKTFEDCKNAIDNGFTNVMIDASSLSIEENIQLTKQVVEYAHANNVTVEAELGVLAGVEDEVSATEEDAFYTNPSDAIRFARETQVDSLAIAIGTSHGTHKFKGEPKLRIDILEAIEKELPELPIVLHGASSIPNYLIKLGTKYGALLEGANGVPEALLQSASKHNVCKINVDSDLRLAYTVGIREWLTLHPEEVDIRKYNNNGKKYIEETIKEKITNVFYSANRY